MGEKYLTSLYCIEQYFSSNPHFHSLLAASLMSLLPLKQLGSSVLTASEKRCYNGKRAREKIVPDFGVYKQNFLQISSSYHINCENTTCISNGYCSYLNQFSSVKFSRSVVSDSLRPHELQHARPPCPSPTPRVHSNSRPLSR